MEEIDKFNKKYTGLKFLNFKIILNDIKIIQINGKIHLT